MRPLLLVLILCIGASSSTAVRCQPSPVLSSSGSGFFVSYDGHVLTNNHVVEECSNLRVEQPGSGATIATVVARDVNNDLALLRTSSRPTMVPKFIPQTRLGQSIYVLGFPMFPVLSSSGNFTLGSVTGLSGPRDDTGLLQISAPVQPGNSGGPLLDKRANVVGVIVGRIERLQNVNFAIKSSIALNFLASNRVVAKESETSASELPPEEIADVAKSFTYASRPLSPVATQHSLPSGRCPLLGPDFHRLDRTSLPGALIQSPRRRAQAAWAGFQGRAPWRSED